MKDLGFALVLLVPLAACHNATDVVDDTGGTSPGASVGGTPAIHEGAGLVSAVPDANRLRVEWRTTGLEDFGGELELFISTDREELYGGRSEPISAAPGMFIFEGLPTGVVFYVGMGIASSAGERLRPIGAVLSARTAAPVFANPSASLVGADGETPATAFADLGLAIEAASLGGGNVWAAEGDFSSVSLTLPAGVDLYGGFTPDFELEQRSIDEHRTVLGGVANDFTLRLLTAGTVQRIDGLTVEGQGSVQNGIDLQSTPIELRSLDVRECNRGMSLSATEPGLTTNVTMVACTFEQNSAEGVWLQGAYSLTIDNCVFQGNGEEGMQFWPWLSPAEQVLHLRMEDSQFLSNGLGGLDMDLGAPAPGPPGGSYDIVIEDCDFDRNGGHGCSIDIDYETTNFWRTNLNLRGSRARANGGSGYVLHLDNPARCVLHRVLASSNFEDGLSVVSEAPATMALVSASSFTSNLGHGVHSSLGNAGVALSHCVLSGNDLGGVLPEQALATVGSSVAQLQPEAFGDSLTRGTLTVDQPEILFRYAPIEYHRVLSQSGAELTLDAPLVNATGLAAELAGDGTLRTIESKDANKVRVTPAPEAVMLPSTLAIFPLSDSVDEDYRPVTDSAVLGAGIATPAGEAVDAGIFGSPIGGAPGVEDLFPKRLFRVSATAPGWGQVVNTQASVRVHFAGGTPDEATLADGFRVIDAAGTVWTVGGELQAGVLAVSPPPGGWSTGDRIELYGSLRALQDGTPLVPLTLLVR
jgi:hypothetical protein